MILFTINITNDTLIFTNGTLVFLTGLLSLLFSILWLVIGWRAMKAHEKLAETARLSHAYSKCKDSNKDPIPQNSSEVKKHDRYKDFISEDVARKFIDKEDLVIAFTEWIEQDSKS